MRKKAKYFIPKIIFQLIRLVLSILMWGLFVLVIHTASNKAINDNSIIPILASLFILPILFYLALLLTTQSVKGCVFIKIDEHNIIAVFPFLLSKRVLHWNQIEGFAQCVEMGRNGSNLIVLFKDKRILLEIRSRDFRKFEDIKSTIADRTSDLGECQFLPNKVFGYKISRHQ